MTTIEINEGAHPGTGLTVRRLAAGTWASGWLEAAQCPRADLEAHHGAGWLEEAEARLTRAEARFYACAPEARAEATAALQADTVEWEDEPAAQEVLAVLAAEFEEGSA